MKKLLSLLPPSHVQLMFRPADWQALKQEFEVIENCDERQLSAVEVEDKIADCDAVITGWGNRPFSRHALDGAPRLRLFAHAGGSVKALFDREMVRDVLVPRGITIYSGNAPLAVNVAEATIGLMIGVPRRWPQLEKEFKERRGPVQSPISGQFLTGATVGLVSASQVARHVLKFLPAFGCRTLLYDPFLSAEAAHQLGTELVGLDDIFAQSDIVSVHAPDLPATKKMIGARQFALLRDGATFINTARGAVIDHDALLAECLKGRLLVALDVTEPEPLAADSPFWNLRNVTLLPHVTGAGHAGYFSIGAQILDALRHVFAGKPVRGAVALESWETLA
jgi:phosphoglycerate dehydrogenase-like enzyme